MKFVITKELGRLNKWLRILGFDTEYFREDNINSALIKALREERVLLTKRNNVGKHPGINILIIKFDDYHKQLKQVVDTFSLVFDREKMFSRCILCNQELTEIDKELVKDKVPQYVYKNISVFKTCPQCGKIYWEGSHWGKVESIIEKIGDKKPETSNQ